MGIGNWLANKLSGGLLDTLHEELEEAQGSASNGWAAVQRWTDHANGLEKERDEATAQTERWAGEAERYRLGRDKYQEAYFKAAKKVTVLTMEIWDLREALLRVSGRVTAWIERWQSEQRRLDGMTFTAHLLEKDLIISRAGATNERERIADYYIPKVEGLTRKVEVLEAQEAERLAAMERARDPETGRFRKSRRHGKV